MAATTAWTAAERAVASGLVAVPAVWPRAAVAAQASASAEAVSLRALAQVRASAAAVHAAVQVLAVWPRALEQRSVEWARASVEATRATVPAH
ncbi:MAG TPA: hypothetical protein VGJ56_02625, partial [Reyranella sp.]